MADETWELYYWPLAGRGEFIRLIFEEAGVPYKEPLDGAGLRQLVAKGALEGTPILSPPIIKKGKTVLYQTPVCCKFLGKEFGLYPDKEEDIWFADILNTTIHDFVAEGRLVFHGRCFTESYYTQKEETKPYIEWFKENRFDRWMSSLERCLGRNKGKDFAVGDKLTYVDLALLQVMRGAESSFTETYKAKIDNYPLLKSHKQRIESRPRLQEYFKSDRSRGMEGNSMM